jgi:predicted AAA+ superfamily ATPase
MKLENLETKMFEPYVKSFFKREEDYSKFEMVCQNGIYTIYNKIEDRGYIVGHGDSSLDLIKKEKENLNGRGYEVFVINYEALHFAEFKKLEGELDDNR